jgi:hypothetical protein
LYITIQKHLHVIRIEIASILLYKARNYNHLVLLEVSSVSYKVDKLEMNFHYGYMRTRYLPVQTCKTSKWSHYRIVIYGVRWNRDDTGKYR